MKSSLVINRAESVSGKLRLGKEIGPHIQFCDLRRFVEPGEKLFSVNELAHVWMFRLSRPAGCPMSGPTMEVFGQPAAADGMGTSSSMTVAADQHYTAGPTAPHPPSHTLGAQIPHTDARWAISITVCNDELTKP